MKRKLLIPNGDAFVDDDEEQQEDLLEVTDITDRSGLA